MKKLILSMLTAFISFAVMAGGPPVSRIQLIHNSTEPLLSVVDIFIDSVLVADDLAFREATAFFSVTVNGDSLDFTIADASSSPLATIKFAPFTASDTVVLMAAGTIGGGDVGVYGYGGLEASPTSSLAAINILHGANDAPPVDVIARGAGTLAEDLIYVGTDYPYSSSGYLGVPAANYVIDIFDSTSTTKVKSYYAPLAPYAGLGIAAVAFASGYLNPGSGQPAFGLFVATTTGMVIPLPEVKSAFAQILHNSADAAAGTVDVYTRNNLSGTAYETVLAANDLAFRAGTAVLPIEFYEGGNDSVTVAVAPSSSSSINDAIWTKKYKLAGNSQYLLFANGILPSSSGYSPATAFDVIAGGAAFQAAGGTGFTDVNIFHGVTDAPTVDVVETAPGNATLADDLSYGEFSGYNAVSSANNYTVEVRDASGTVNPLGGNFFLPLGLNPQANGAAIVVFASGFLDPTNNNNGASFQLCAKGGTAGAATCFSPIPLSVEEKAFVSNMIMYPNPASSNFNIEYMLESAQSVKVNVYNAAGQLQISADNGVENKGRGMTTLNVSNLASGMYLVNVLVGENVNVTRSIIVE